MPKISKKQEIEISSNQISPTFHHLFFWTFGKHCVPGLRGTIRGSSGARLSCTNCALCIRTKRRVSKASDADTSSLRLENSTKFITSSSVVKAFFMPATSQLSHCCANGVLRLSSFCTSFCSFTRFPVQHHDHVGSCCTYASTFFAASSAAIILFLLFEAAATIDLSRDVVALAFLCAEPPSPFARCEGSLCALRRCPRWRRRRMFSVRSVESWSHGCALASGALRADVRFFVEFPCFRELLRLIFVRYNTSNLSVKPFH